MKKIGALFLAIILILSVNFYAAASDDESSPLILDLGSLEALNMIPSVEVESDYVINGKKFVIDNIVYEVIKCDKNKGDFEVQVGTGWDGEGLECNENSFTWNLNIPDSVYYEGNNYKVVSISKGAFKNRHIFTVNIGDNVRTIGAEAFKNCTFINELNFGGRVESIGEMAFKGCLSLKEVKMPRLLKSIGKGSFKDCKGLEEVTMLGSLKVLSSCTFQGCKNLEKVNFVASFEIVEEICKDLKKSSFVDRLEIIEDHVFEGCESLNKMKMPKSLIAIGDSSFKNCLNLKSITLSSKTRCIRDHAFENCSELEKIEIPRSVVDIGKESFQNCKKLENVVLNKGIKFIEDSAFEYCEKLNIINIPSSVECIGESVFSGCRNLEKIEVDNNNLFYASKNGVLFNKFETKLIKFPERSLLEEYVVPNTVEIIGREAFLNCDLKSIKISDTTKIIEKDAFVCSTIEAINLGNGLERIEKRGFANVYSLKFIVIPESVKYIGDDTFFNYTNFTNIYVRGKKNASEFKDGIGKRWSGLFPVKYI